MKRLTPFLYFTLAALAAAAPFYAAPPQAFAQQQHTLYQRLGGYDALAARWGKYSVKIFPRP